ncbi:unnamed protein product [Rhizoctonia solani]|uniref:Uncharacterized protein n=1 Tax=Rhizoctonia solani TaxID=456999 RepID=A0A8H3DZK5_9AGAM|nr:unnamed protein product [Rhizoctonia solani]
MSATSSEGPTDSETTSRVISIHPHGVSAYADNYASTKSTELSATDLAARADEFVNWAHGIKLDPVIRTIVPDAAVFSPIRNLQAAATEVPGWMKNPNSPEFGYISSIYQKWRDILCSTLQQSGYSTGHDGDDHLLFAIQNIFRICHHHEMMQSTDNYGLGSEDDVYVFIDSLIQSCRLNSDPPVMYRMERVLRLPIPAPDRARVATITASGVMLLPIVNFGPWILSPEFRIAASAVSTAEEAPDMIFVHYITELKCTDNSENKMKMGMVSALLQKKALGVPTQFVFGIFRSGIDFIRVNAGLWLDDEMEIYRVGTYSLRSPASLVEFYLVLQGIFQLVGVNRDQLMELAPALEKAIKTKPPVDEWAPIYIPTSSESYSENSEESGFQSVVRLSPALSSLGKWDVDNRIDSFLQSMGSCDPDATDDAEISWTT